MKGYPADGAVDVPLDAVPFYDAFAAWSEGGMAAREDGFLQLRDSNGTTVPIEVEETYVSTLTLTPERELEPNTRYTVELRLTGVNSEAILETLEFETGTSHSAAPEEPGATFLQHYELLDYRGGCASQRGTCVALPDDATIVATFSDDDGAEFNTDKPYLWRKEAFVDLTGIDQGTPFVCVNLRTRAPNGALSDATQHCGRDAPYFELDGGDNPVCTSAGISFQGRLVTDPTPTTASSAPEGRGCSLSLGGSSGSGTAPWILLLGAAALRVCGRNIAVFASRTARISRG